MPAWFDTLADSRALFIAECVLLALMTASVVTRTWQDHIWMGFLLTGVTVLVWSPELFRARFRRWWFAYVAGIFFYTLLRAYADETAMPIRTEYPIDVDRALFFGADPVTWLQGKMFSASRVDLLDYFAVAVHWSFFVAPHAMAIGIFLWRRPRFAQYIVIIVGTMYLGLLLFFLIPTTPPWLAGLQGELSGALRVMDFVGSDLSAGTYRRAYASLGEPNSVAAMPSIHMGVTFAMFLWSLDHARRWRVPLFVYSVVMGFCLVYLAEHYVVDLLAGVACAVIAYGLSRPFAKDTKALEHSPATR